jgi:predicted dehydrogenase
MARRDLVVLVGENDHYKPLAVRLRRLLAENAIGDLVFAQFTTVAKRLKTADDWRNDEAMAGGDAFFEEGIHWLHLAGSLGPRITAIHGYRPPVSANGPDRRAKSMMVAFQYDNGVGPFYYSREVPSLFRVFASPNSTGVTASSRSNPTVGSCWCAAVRCRASCCRVCVTSAAIRR